MTISGRLIQRFSYHPATSKARQDAHHEVREQALALAALWEETVPPGDERRKAIDAIELAMFYANAAVARQQEPDIG